MAAKKTSPKQKKETASLLPDASQKSKIPAAKKRNIIMIVVAILVIICIAAIGIYYFLQYKKPQQLFNGPLLTTQMTQTELITKVGQLIALPTGEQPTIASVSDITKLKGQTFFKNARNGDIVLVYPKAGEAILYDPFVNKIMQVGPVNHPQPTSSKTSAAYPEQSIAGAQTTAEPVTVALYNGTTIAGFAKKTEIELAEKMPNVTVVSEANASSSAYTQTTVIDLTGNNTTSAQQLATFLHGITTSLPAAETKPANADLLIILGSK